MEGVAQVAEGLDRGLTLWLNGFNSPLTDSFWTFMSRTAVWIPLYAIVLLVILYRLGWRRTLVALAFLAIVILCTDQLGNLVKEATGRLRPCHDQWMIDAGLNNPVGKGGMYGFFSAHAANAFAFATASYNILKADSFRSYTPYAWVIYVWAALVGASRVFLGKHFLGDVLVGALVGILIGYLLGVAARKTILCVRAH